MVNLSSRKKAQVNVHQIKKLAKREILSLLGIGNDPIQPLSWYVERHANLKEIIENQIKQDFNKANVFPFEAAKLSELEANQNYSEIIRRKNKREFVVQQNDTDTGKEIRKSKLYTLEDAISYYLSKAY